VRILGLDVGDKRIGVAVSDEMGWTAQPVKTIQRVSRAKDLAAVAELVAEYQAQAVVLGLPRNMDGSLGPQAAKTQAFGRALAEAVAAEVLFWDERWSTKAAERTLLEADLSRAKRRKVLDQVAAGFILQGYLDHRARHGEAR
jgi:putative Holliday junction resolvase